MKLAENEWKNEINHGLMQEINPDCVSSDCREPFYVNGIEEFRKNAVLRPDSEAASRKEQEKPRKQRKIVRRLEWGIVYTEREQNADFIRFLRQAPLKKPADTYKSVLNVPRQRKKQREHDNPDKRGNIVENLLAKPENHHRNTEKVQYSEHNGNLAEKRRDKRDNHTEKKALRAAFDVVSGEAADRSRYENEYTRENIADYVEPVVEENRHVNAENVF